MMTLEMAPGLKMDIDLIDQEHARFYTLMNRLVNADTGGEDRQLVADVLSELSAYVVDHFDTEEDLMARFGYPELGAHQQLHAGFKNLVGDLQQRFADGDVGLEDELMAELVKWFTEHVRYEDQKYAPLFKANGL